MTEDIKRARHFPCPFCVDGHRYASGFKYCLGNPDRDANRKIRSELNRISYEKTGARERLKKAGDNEITRIKKSNTTKKMWEQGILGDTAGEKNGMYGKKHKLESRLKCSVTLTKTASATVMDRIASMTETAVKNENLVAPIFGTAAEFFNKKIDKDGWVEVENDHWSSFSDDFDPFH